MCPPPFLLQLRVKLEEEKWWAHDNVPVVIHSSMVKNKERGRGRRINIGRGRRIINIVLRVETREEKVLMEKVLLERGVTTTEDKWRGSSGKTDV